MRLHLVEEDLTPSGPQPHQANVSQDRVEPSTHGGGLTHCMYLPQSYDESIVHGVLRLGTVAQDAEGLPVQRGPVAFEQNPQARHVAPLRRPDQLRIAQYLTSRHAPAPFSDPIRPHTR